MAVVHRLDAKRPSKYGFKKARRSVGSEEAGQLNLFNASAAGRILRLPSRLGPFASALLLDERSSPEAADAYVAAIENGDCVADAYCNLGIIRYHGGDTGEALRCFTRSLQINPSHFESHYNLGNLFFDQGDLEAARVQYELAASIDGSFANLFFNLGLLLALLDDYRLSFNAFNTYRALAPDEEGRRADPLLETLRESLEAS